MQCLKCGRNTNNDQVFCAECLDIMAASPVKPGTPVTIPVRVTKQKRPVKKQVKPEEIIQKLNKKLRYMRILAAVLAVLLALTAGVLVYQLSQTDSGFDIGQNYFTIPSDSTGN